MGFAGKNAVNPIPVKFIPGKADRSHLFVENSDTGGAQMGVPLTIYPQAAWVAAAIRWKMNS